MASSIDLRISRLAKVSLTIALVMTFLLGHGLVAAAMEIIHAEHQVVGHEIDSSCLLLVKDPAGSDERGATPSVPASVMSSAPTGPLLSLETGTIDNQPSIHGLCVLRV